MSSRTLSPKSPERSSRAVRRYLVVFFAALTGIFAYVLFDFLFGPSYFAYSDIGSDTHFQFIPQAMHLARELHQGWPLGWTFELGLGADKRLWLNPFLLLNAAFGPDAVPSLRVWVYLLKVVVGGTILYFALLAMGRRPLSASVMALAYSFSCVAVIDGQWDPHATDFAMYPLLMLGFVHALADPNRVWVFPLGVAVAAVSGVFPFSMGVFVVYCCAAAVVASDTPNRTARFCLVVMLPLAALGIALAAPVVIGNLLQILDSPRVSGAQSGMANRLAEATGINNGFLIYAQIAGLFHKDVLGIGSEHRGWMNYLESPGFGVGLLPLLLIPQLWHGTRQDRRILIALLLTLALFVTFPAFRYLAFGFALPYFRVNNLWLTLLLIVVAARGLDIVLDGHGSRRALTAGFAATLLALTYTAFAPYAAGRVQFGHIGLIAVMLAITAIAAFTLVARPEARWRTAALFIPIALSAALVAQPSFNAGRDKVSRATFGYNDATKPALEWIARQDRDFYRVEKSFDSVFYCDSLAQGYRGVKSYWFQGASTVAFYIGLGLIPPRHNVVNYTNWLPAFGQRFALYTLVGVRYYLSMAPVRWPGFREIAVGNGLRVYRNDLALPLGFVQSAQLPRAVFDRLNLEQRDFAMLAAAVVDTPLGAQPMLLDPAALMFPAGDPLQTLYLDPATRLAQRGLRIEHFADDHIVGSIRSDQAGIAVFTIPFARGWSLKIDGAETPVHRVNLGFIGAPVTAGEHRVELRYDAPGTRTGIIISAVALMLLFALVRRSMRTPIDGTLPQPRGKLAS